MKRTISLRELHEATGKWVREAARREALVITERGAPIATIVRYEPPAPGNRFKARKLLPGYAKLLGRLGGGPDSARMVSEDRDRG